MENLKNYGKKMVKEILLIDKGRIDLPNYVLDIRRQNMVMNSSDFNNGILKSLMED